MGDLLDSTNILSFSENISLTWVLFLSFSLSLLYIEACNLFFTHSIYLGFAIHKIFKMRSYALYIKGDQLKE